MKIFYTAFFILYLLIVFVWPTVRTCHQTRIDPVTFGNTNNAHDSTGKWFKIITGFLLIAILCSWLGSPVYNYLIPITYLQHHVLQLTGVFLALLSLSRIATAQHQMASAWRIAVDYRNKTQLVQRGLFSVSSNPVFLGILFSLT